MKRYTTPKITSDSIEERSFAVPAILGVVAGVVAAKAVSKALDSVFERSLSFINANRLEPVLA